MHILVISGKLKFPIRVRKIWGEKSEIRMAVHWKGMYLTFLFSTILLPSVMFLDIIFFPKIGTQCHLRSFRYAKYSPRAHKYEGRLRRDSYLSEEQLEI